MKAVDGGKEKVEDSLLFILHKFVLSSELQGQTVVLFMPMTNEQNELDVKNRLVQTM